MYDQKLTVFLSHSHKDAEKVRKIRDILETLGCEPLMFFLKCLDDDNGELEDFIKREIDARNVFLYCKSKNAEASEWVQKELEYIRSRKKRRIYEVDIDNDFCGGTVSLLNGIMDMIRRNNVFVSYSMSARKAAYSIIDYLEKEGLNVIRETDLSEDICGFSVGKAIEKAAKEGVVIVINEEGKERSVYQQKELEKAQKEGAKILRITISKDDGQQGLPPGALGMGVPDNFNYLKKAMIRREIRGDQAYIDEQPTMRQLENVYDKLMKL